VEQLSAACLASVSIFGRTGLQQKARLLVPDLDFLQTDGAAFIVLAVAVLVDVALVA
jgi:hypothetical protein